MDSATVLDRVDAIVPKLADLAERCDEARRLAPESMQTLVSSGVFRIPQPARTGGYELDLRTLGAAVTKLSRGCAASGWVLMVMGAHHFCMGTFSEDAQDEVFGDGRDGLVAGTLSWQGNAVACDGGYRVNGRWQFCSGVDHSEWVMLGCADPDTYAPRVHVVVRPEEIEIEDTWHVMGLQGTGSHDVVAHDVFVPEHRAIDTRLMFGGRSPFVEGHATNLYRLSPEAMLSMSVSTAVLGSAQHAHDAFVERTKERRVILTGAKKAEHAPTQIRAAESEGELRAAHLLQQDVYDAFDRLLETGERFDRAHTAWARWRVLARCGPVSACRREIVGRFWGARGLPRQCTSTRVPKRASGRSTREPRFRQRRRSLRTRVAAALKTGEVIVRKALDLSAHVFCDHRTEGPRGLPRELEGQDTDGDGLPVAVLDNRAARHPVRSVAARPDGDLLVVGVRRELDGFADSLECLTPSAVTR